MVFSTYGESNKNPLVVFLWQKKHHPSLQSFVFFLFFRVESDFGSKEKFGGLMSYTWSDIITNKSYRHYRILGE